MIFVAKGAFCQQMVKSFAISPVKDTAWVRSCFGNKFQKYYQRPKQDSVCTDKRFLPVSFLPANYYSTHLGFFCKQEIKMEKITKVPFKFRLGSVAECDRMEGKRN